MSTNIIKFTCDDLDTYNSYPPVPATKVIPEWYKNMPNEIHGAVNFIADGTPSVKRCIPVLDYMTSGYIIRNSYQILVTRKVDSQGIVGFELKCNKPDYAGGHPWYQAQVAVQGVKTHYLKINQPWQTLTPPGYSCLIYQPHYFFRKEFSLFPGVVDTDKHPDPIGLIGQIHATHDFIIEPGEPLAVVFPFKRADWRLETAYDPKLVDQSPYKYFLKATWRKMYSTFFHSRKSYR